MSYCVKCKTKRTMQNPTPTVLRNRKRLTHATRGSCPACGTTMYHIHK